MGLVRNKEAQAEILAHVLDDMFRIPGTRIRVGMDPLLGLIPVVGDSVATLLGIPILVIARQLHVPWRIVAYMAWNQLRNGLIGAVPFIGDAYSFHFKSNAVNAALLLRTVKRGNDGACVLAASSVPILDMLGVAAMTIPIVALVAFVSVWFWSHNVSYLSVLFPSPYGSR